MQIELYHGKISESVHSECHQYTSNTNRKSKIWFKISISDRTWKQQRKMAAIMMKSHTALINVTENE